MPVYNYVAQDNSGQELKGQMNAASREDVVIQLRQKQLIVITIEQKKGLLQMEFGEAKVKVKLDEMVIFTRQLSTMISAGIPLLESLEILQDQQANQGFAKVLGDVVDRVRSGSDLSTALAAHLKIFPKIYVSMVKAGEASGQLDVILTRLAEYQEATAKLRREIKSAMTYPVISLAMIFGITGFLLVGIIPKFKEIFVSLGVDLPGITVGLLELSDFLQLYWLELGGGLIGFSVFLKVYAATKQGRRHFDFVKLKSPVFGPLFQKVAISRFTRTFATLIRSGVPILGSLEIVGQTSGNTIIEDAVRASMNNVKQGESLADPLSDFWVFPPMVTKMIAIGERAGALESLLEKISEFYDQQVSASVETLTSLIEPLMIGVMGFIVGGIVLAVFLPIFKLQEQLARGG
ncbi:type II secretion system F family protein [Candidatus Uabimicrobium amorphum]|uniref:Type II secretion system protein F n=1 Tax=Uabimicrobium amorphum TaxID=2596890 RepID=A0A5S9IX29_UABAM|nr:type II secretion system F family protein [Candidatus Uabimicrobium amorphum]BBM88105.1 type II secretion system protein F [Candidatus Uabimicrobium amorphum]